MQETYERHGFDPWVGKIPWRRAWQPTPVVLPGESHGQRSLGGYSSWSHRELNTTEVTSHACTPLSTQPVSTQFCQFPSVNISPTGLLVTLPPSTITLIQSFSVFIVSLPPVLYLFNPSSTLPAGRSHAQDLTMLPPDAHPFQ